ncbi:branched-chain amino acid ABC transporter permease [Rugosimonospora acidiphila]|uniref:Branched-chain amino acid ABC transporter permease n=1 Tax=Rugosimonospora acidiphila TaxID=556531 RepID=A0ABP9RLE9_9ACTN
MNAFLQSTVYGLLQGGLLALVAVGFSLVWGVMNVINLAHGAFVVVGAYVAWQLNEWLGLDPFIAMFGSMAFLFVTGYLVQRLLVNLVVNAPVFITLLLTFGLDLLLTNGLIMIYSGNYRAINTSYALKSLALGGVRVPVGRLLGCLLAVACSLLLVSLMKRTRTGLAIAATGMDRGAARLMGIRARHIYALTFGIAAALAGLAGAMLATVGTFSPADASKYTLFSFVIAVLGGLGNMYGALAGGLLLGLVESWAGQYLSGTLVNAVAFGLLVLVLVARPAGLLGRPFYESRLEV